MRRGQGRERASVLRVLPFAAALLAGACGPKAQSPPDGATDRPAGDLGPGDDVQPPPDGAGGDTAADASRDAPDGGAVSDAAIADASRDAPDGGAVSDAVGSDAPQDTPQDAVDDGRRDTAADSSGDAAGDGGSANAWPAPTVCTGDGWCWMNPWPHGLPLDAVWGTGADDVWAVGFQGGAVRWDGGRWSWYDTATRQSLFALGGSGPSDVWAVGPAGTITRFDGTRWQPFASGTTAQLTEVWGFAPNDIWVAGAEGTVRRWDGAAWSVVRNPAGSASGEQVDALWARARATSGAVRGWQPPAALGRRRLDELQRFHHRWARERDLGRERERRVGGGRALVSCRTGQDRAGRRRRRLRARICTRSGARARTWSSPSAARGRWSAGTVRRGPRCRAVSPTI